MNKTKQLITILKKYQTEFHPVVPFNAEQDKLLLFDFSENNKEIPGNILDDTDQFIGYVNNKLQTANAKFGIGGYVENRKIYSQSKLFDGSQVSTNVGDLPTGQAGLEGAEPRRLHLGVDIWGKPHTPVMAPLDGIVHSFAFNNNFGDYGVTIILTHILDDFSFHTLYGHLSLNDIKNLHEGQRIEKEEVFAEFGIPIENGHWPPHLHFQIIIDLEDYKGDYPGVCKFSEKEKYLSNCPDADLILQMIKYV